jgi:hypothetical protein
MAGPNPISRLAGWPGVLPASQGYIGTGGPMFQPVPKVFVIPGPVIGEIAPEADDIGIQWAPGQGGDTPGGGGAAMIGNTVEVETAWLVAGFVVPIQQKHASGSVGWIGSRRGRA